MKKILTALVIVLLVPCLPKISIAQDTLYLFTGDKVIANKINTSDSIYLSYTSAKNKLKQISKSDIFEIMYANGSQTYLYAPENELEFTINEMHMYLKGKTDANQNYKNKAAFYGGLSVGIISPLVCPPLGISSTLMPLIPAGFLVINGLSEMNEQKFVITDQFKDNKHYKLGYTEMAKKKRFNTTLKGTGIGLALGITAALLIFEL